jgi:hypothetical protein
MYFVIPSTLILHSCTDIFGFITVMQSNSPFKISFFDIGLLRIIINILFEVLFSLC